MAKLKNLDPNNIIVVKPTKQIESIEAVEEFDDVNEKSVIPKFDTTGLDSTDAKKTLNLFESAFNELAHWESYEKTIVVNSIDDVSGMIEAKLVRDAVREIRKNSEEVKKSAKASILLKGRYIDSIYNTINTLCKSIENNAAEKENYVARLMEEKRQRIFNERITKLMQFEYNYSHLDLINMPDVIFESTLADAKDLFELKVKRREDELAAEKKAEEAEKLKRELEQKRLTRLTRLNELSVTTDKDIDNLSDDEFEAHVIWLIKDKRRVDELNKRIADRKHALGQLGFSRTNDGFKYISPITKFVASVPHEALEYSDAKWTKEFKALTSQINKIKNDEEIAERKRIERRELALTRHVKLCEFEPESFSEYSMQILGEMSEERWLEIYEKVKFDSNVIRSNRETELEAQRISKLSDSQIINEYFNTILNVPVPTPSSKTLSGYIENFHDIISSEARRINSIASDGEI